MPFPSWLIILLVTIGFLAAIRHTIRQFKGKGGCCGGGTDEPPSQKESAGSAFAKRRLHIEGMSCMHCVARVTQALNALDGVVAQVHLTPPTAIVTLGKEVSDETLRQAVSDAGFQITSIEEIPLS
ncbi:MAG: heavy-metal-associated domain-containing protein [Victivallales bacterium]|nr:heavy-metal-associated domain-containing protein [Victivallales bacterium]